MSIGFDPKQRYDMPASFGPLMMPPRTEVARAGSLHIAIAAFEGDDPLRIDRLTTTTVLTDDGYCLTGTKVAMIGGGTAAKSALDLRSGIRGAVRC